MSNKNPTQYIGPDLVVSVDNGLVTFENGKTAKYDPDYLALLITEEVSDHTILEEKRVAILFKNLAPTITHELFLCEDEQEKKKKMADIVENLIRESDKVQLPEHSQKALYEMIIRVYFDTIKKAALSFSDTWNTYRDMAYAKVIGKEFADQATFDDYQKILNPLTKTPNGKHPKPDGEA